MSVTGAHSLFSALNIRHLGIREWSSVVCAMRRFTSNRNPNSADEIWMVEHFPIYTQGQAGKAEHILNAGTIPVLQSDRGGQVTYHGLGQQIMYCLIDLKRNNLGVRQLVNLLENTVINTLAEYGIAAHARLDAPGVYVQREKICSLGLRIRRGCSFHGLALNVAMDLGPFQNINPCGYPRLKMTQLADFINPISLQHVSQQLVKHWVLLQPYHTINRFHEMDTPDPFSFILNGLNE